MDGGSLLRLTGLFRISQGGSVGFVDKLNYRFTGAIMMIIITIVSARQYMGKPIQCWVPQEFTHAWEDYTEHICWVQNTYFLLPTQPVPQTNIETLDERHVTYYQWVSIFLALQAVLTYIPHLIWNVASFRIPLLLRSASEASLPDKELRKKAVSILTAALEEQAEFSTRFQKKSSIVHRVLTGLGGPSSRNTTVFLLCRILSIGNSVGQVYLMQHYLGYRTPLFGIRILNSVASGNDWKQSGYFPRVTFCRVEIRRWNIREAASYTIQCVLSLNFFLEKVYVFLWFWFCSMACITLLNTLMWTFNLCVPFRRTQFVSQYLRALKQVTSNDERECERFVRQVLGPDGILLLRAVSAVSSDLIALDVSSKLWSKYKHSKSTGNDDNLSKFLDNLHRSTGVAVV